MFGNNPTSLQNVTTERRRKISITAVTSAKRPRSCPHLHGRVIAMVLQIPLPLLPSYYFLHRFFFTNLWVPCKGNPRSCFRFTMQQIVIGWKYDLCSMLQTGSKTCLVPLELGKVTNMALTPGRHCRSPRPRRLLVDIIKMVLNRDRGIEAVPILYFSELNLKDCRLQHHD